MRQHNQSLQVECGVTHTLAVPVTPRDKIASSYLYVALDIPDNITRIDIGYQFAKAHNFEIDIGLFDPTATVFPSAHGFRGWSGGARSNFFVAEEAATPGYVAGPLHPGRWWIILGLVQVPDGTAEIVLSAAGHATTQHTPSVPLHAASPVRTGPLWARGDCHCHTFHSDAKGSPQTLHAQAHKAGLDFLFVTDHNTCTAWSDYFVSASSPELIFIPGMEITVSQGHGNALGIDRWVDFRLENYNDPTALLKQTHGANGLLSINHDKPDIAWYLQVPDIDCMEVWQRPWLVHNDVSRDRYDLRLLTQRRRITAIGGSDWHQPEEVSDSTYVVGNPTTVLWCDHLSREAVMAALRRGTGYVTEGPAGPALEVQVNQEPMGSLLQASADSLLQVITTKACGDLLVLIADGREIERCLIDETGVVETRLPAGLSYVRAEIIACENRHSLMNEFRQWLFDNGQPRGVGGWQDRGQPIVRAFANPHYFGEWQ